MAEHMPGDPDADDRFVRLDDGDMHVVEDGRPGAPGLLLIHGTAASTAWWDPVIPQLAGDCRVIRVDMAGHGRSSAPAGGYDIPAQARRAGAVLDRLGAGQVTVIGHSTGGYVATALASAFTRPIDIPGTIIEATMGMTHRALAVTSRASDDYLKQQTLPGRLAALGLPVLVIVGADDKRWRSTSAAAYRTVPGARLELLPGVGHTPMMEDPQTTSTLLLDFAAAARHPS